MKFSLNYTWIVSLIFLAGCQTTAPLEPVKDISNNKVHLIDSRTEESKKSYRSSVTSPLMKLGDDKFETPPLDYLKINSLKICQMICLT